MYKFYCKLLIAVTLMFTSMLGVANTTIDNKQGCAMRNLDVLCKNGETIKLDFFRTAFDSRGVIYINIKTQGAIGDFILLYINNNTKPDIIKVASMPGLNVASTNSSKGAFIPLPLIRKLQNATSINFSIMMKKGSPIDGSLTQDHFEWMKRFGKTCK